VITITWRTKLTVLVGGTFVAASLTLAFPGAGAGATPTPGATHAARPTPGATHAARPTRGATHATHGAGGGAAPVVRNGDNGTVKVHRSTTPVTDRRNEPHVCVFYLDAFGFDSGQDVTWQIKSWPPTGDRTVVAFGTLTLDNSGDGRTGDENLPNGHYKLFWNFNGENGFAKQKVFWVACGAKTPPPTSSPSPSPSESSSSASSSTLTSTPSSSSSSPGHGGLPITGWPLALVAGTGVALLGTGGTAMVMARRRRGSHSSR
jgi:hypothetical protein